MKSAYEISRLSDAIVLIVWNRSPDADSEAYFLQDLKHLLDDATSPQYLISDLRKGRIVTVRTIQRLSSYTEHPNWGGSTAFTKNPITKSFVRTFQNFITEPESNNAMHDTPEEAIAFIESLQPGITNNVDWEAIIYRA